MKTELFGKVYTKDRLPEKSKTGIIAYVNNKDNMNNDGVWEVDFIKSGPIGDTSIESGNESFWNDRIDWWLEELPQPSDEDIENAAEKYLNVNGNRYPSPDIAYQQGAKPIKPKTKPKEEIKDCGTCKFVDTDNIYPCNKCDEYFVMYQKDYSPPSQPVGEVKSAEEIFKQNWHGTFGDSCDDSLEIVLKHDYIFEAMEDYHNQFPKVVLPTEEQIKDKMEYYTIPAFKGGFRACFDWIKSLNK